MQGEVLSKFDYSLELSKSLENFKRQWIADYKTLSGDAWDSPVPTDTDAETAFAKEYPKLNP